MEVLTHSDNLTHYNIIRRGSRLMVANDCSLCDPWIIILHLSSSIHKNGSQKCNLINEDFFCCFLRPGRCECEIRVKWLNYMGLNEGMDIRVFTVVEEGREGSFCYLNSLWFFDVLFYSWGLICVQNWPALWWSCDLKRRPLGGQFFMTCWSWFLFSFRWFILVWFVKKN